MITIENKEDIKLLIEFVNILNVNEETTTSEPSEVDVKQEILELKHSLKMKADTIVKTHQRLLKVEKQLETIIQNQSTEEPSADTSTYVREYHQEYPEYTNIKCLNKDGTFSNTKGKPFSFQIQDILKLQQLIPKIEEYPTWNSLQKVVKVNGVQRLCQMIEKGFFEKYLNEWEQLQADDFFGRWKPVVVENNPQKRREILGMG